MSKVSHPSFLEFLASVANEVMEEDRSQQRFNAQGKPLRRTKVVDPKYHSQLFDATLKNADDRARTRVNSMFATC